MVQKAISEIITLIYNDTTIRLTALLITLVISVLGIVYSPLAAIILYLCYILGFIVCWGLITYQTRASSCLQRLASFYRERLTPKKNLKHSCSICDDLSCKRHVFKSVVPWKHLYIQEDLNQALEQFYNRIIENFITSWYGELTEDNDFVNELRYCLRYASASVINRFLELDAAHIISNKLIPCAVKHVDDYLYMQQIAKLKNSRFNDVIVEYLGKRLHAAVSNRKNELTYLQHLTATLMPFVLPERYLRCRNFSVLIREIIAGWVFLPLMDVISDPNILNLLVILCITYKPKKGYRPVQFKNVEFLDNFAIRPPSRKSSFSIDLNNVKKNTELLYAFMQFLKREEHVHLLQFCLDVDDFNNKLLTPDLAKKQLEELYTEAYKLHKEYLNKNSISFIGCSDSIEQNMASLLEDGVYSVAKLRTSKPLYQAYEYAFNVLESVWLPIFFHSNEFYSHICGSKITATYNKAAVNKSPLLSFGSPTKMRNRKYYESSQGTVSKISSGLGKIKGALKTSQPIDGALYPSESHSIENGAIEDLILTDAGDFSRDLSAWRVSISSYQPGNNKTINFCISVQRLDSVSSENKRHWVVLRKDQDFFTLKAKLIEFHGENEICDSPLPSRKSGNTIEMRMTKYEDFIRKLLQKPTLRGSDLLYTFLTAEEDFTFLVVTSAPAIQDLGNIYQSVAHKLRKEKGQHLDSFMATFLGSVGRSKQGKFEFEIGDEVDNLLNIQERNPPLPRTYRNHIFNDNFGIQYQNLKETSSTSFHPVGITECLFYLLKHILKVRHGILKLYAAICSVAQQAVESICRLIIDHKLKTGLSQSNLAYLIHLLEGVIFEPHSPPTKLELEERRRKAFHELQGVISPLLARILGREVSSGLTKILEILQHPHYNKQLAYNLVDIILTEMYPNLDDGGEQERVKPV